LLPQAATAVAGAREAGPASRPSPAGARHCLPTCDRSLGDFDGISEIVLLTEIRDELLVIAKVDRDLDPGPLIFYRVNLARNAVERNALHFKQDHNSCA
jgi:hypothetical protein